MASVELERLYKLFLIDSGMVEVKKKATALESGKRMALELESARKEQKLAEGKFHLVHGEQKDLELANQQIDDKIKSIDKQLFSGSVVNPKEIENFEHQKKMLTQQRSMNDEKILEYWEAVPPLQRAAEAVKKHAEQLESELNEWKVKAVKFKSELETQYKELALKRPEAAKGVPAPLLARYEAIAKGSKGIGMTKVTREGTCLECGNGVAERIIMLLKSDQVATCEECRRIFYWNEGVS